MISQAKVDALKEKHEKEMQNYSQQARDYIQKYGNDECEYLRYRRDMALYHRGAYNALIELERA